MIKREDLEMLENFLEEASKSIMDDPQLFATIGCGDVFRGVTLESGDDVTAFVRVRGRIIRESDIEKMVNRLHEERDFDGLLRVAGIFERYGNIGDSLSAAAQLYRVAGNAEKEDSLSERVLSTTLERVNGSIFRLKERFDIREIRKLSYCVAVLMDLAKKPDDTKAQDALDYVFKEIEDTACNYALRGNFRAAFEVLKIGDRFSAMEQVLLPAVTRIKGYELLTEIAGYLSKNKRQE